MDTFIQDPQHAVKGISFTYRYNVGYGPAGRERGSNFTVILASACSSADPNKPQVLGVLYESPGDLTAPAFDACPGCFSDPVTVDLTLDTPISVATLAKVAFVFTDNDRNLNLPAPIDVTLFWA